jgi:hypothetical protein
MSDVGRAINELLAAAPGPCAAPEVRANWFDQKARVFELIAESDPFVADESREQARKAREFAAELRQAG